MKRTVISLLLSIVPFLVFSDTVLLKPKDNKKNEDQKNKDKDKRLPMRPLTCDVDAESGIITFYIMPENDSSCAADIIGSDGSTYPLITAPTVNGTIIASLPMFEPGLYDICITVNDVTYSGVYEF